MQLGVVVSNCDDYIGYKQAQVMQVVLLWQKNSATRTFPGLVVCTRGKAVALRGEAVLQQQETLWSW